MEPPVFTVVIATYRRHALLKKAVASVLAQHFVDFECLVINDYPADNEKIEELVTAFGDPRLKFIPAHQSRGGNYCRNFGIKLAQGRYIAFLDDDDSWFPEKLEQHEQVHQQENADLVFSDYIKHWSDEERPDQYINAKAVPGDIPRAMIDGRFSIGTTSSVSLKKKDLREPVFDESLVSFQDWDAWLRIAIENKQARFRRIQKALICFNQHSGDRTSRNAEKREHGFRQLLEKHLQLKGSGFYFIELLNISVMKIDAGGGGSLRKRFELLVRFLVRPAWWFRKYTVKRTARYLLLGR